VKVLTIADERGKILNWNASAIISKVFGGGCFLWVRGYGKREEERLVDAAMAKLKVGVNENDGERKSAV